jgi:hypothetical protein
MDPMGPGSIINMITVTVTGTFGCDQQDVSPTPSISIYIAGAKLGDLTVCYLSDVDIIN